MPCDFTYMWKSKKQRKQTEQKQIHRQGEHFDGCQMGKGLQGG